MSDRVLLVMRHAKSSWDADVADHARALTDRGRRDAARMARALHARGWMPDHVLCSDAIRARETLSCMEDTLGRDLPNTLLESLYLPSVDDLRRALARHTPPDARTILIVSHNPGIEEAITWLTGESVELATANIARLTGSASTWDRQVETPATLRLDTVLRPKEVAASE